MASEAITYDKAELRSITRAFKAMDDEAIDQAKSASSALADFVKSKIVDAAALTRSNTTGSLRLAISFGFAGQKFSGGATTQQLWGGLEFGSNKYKQFPVWSGREGRGSRGWFIYPTLRSAQPEIIRRWEDSFSQIVKKYD